MTGPKDVPADVLGDIAYLSRSANRVEVLEALISKPHSTRALRDATDSSKTTLSRILNEFEERAWAVRNVDGQYEATPLGEHVAVQFRSLVESLATLRDLGENSAILPPSEMTLGSDGGLTVSLEIFSEATVKQQQPEAQGVGRHELVEAVRRSDSMHVLTDIAPPRILGSALQDRSVQGDLSGAFVFTDGLTEYLLDNPDLPPTWGEVIEAGIDILRLEGPIPANIVVFDDMALIWGASGEMRRRVIISHNESVRQWALHVVDRYRDRADHLSSEDFA